VVNKREIKKMKKGSGGRSKLSVNMKEGMLKAKTEV
jgi:hypothetical protein